jgi:hypothetical protein
MNAISQSLLLFSCKRELFMLIRVLQLAHASCNSTQGVIFPGITMCLVILNSTLFFCIALVSLAYCHWQT